MNSLEPGFFHFGAKHVRGRRGRKVHRDVLGYMRQDRERNLRNKSRVFDVQSYMTRLHDLAQAQREVLYHTFRDRGSGLSSEKLWIANDQANRARDGQYKQHAGHLPRLGVFLTLSYPYGVTLEQAVSALNAFLDFLESAFGVAAEAVIHEKNGLVDHAHILMTDRRFGPEGVGPKNRDLNGIYSKYSGQGVKDGETYLAAGMESMRAKWSAEMRKISSAVSDHRSFVRRGIRLVPVANVLQTEIRRQILAGHERWRDRRALEMASRILGSYDRKADLYPRRHRRLARKKAAGRLSSDRSHKSLLKLNAGSPISAAAPVSSQAEPSGQIVSDASKAQALVSIVTQKLTGLRVALLAHFNAPTSASEHERSAAQAVQRREKTKKQSIQQQKFRQQYKPAYLISKYERVLQAATRSNNNEASELRRFAKYTALLPVLVQNFSDFFNIAFLWSADTLPDETSVSAWSSSARIVADGPESKLEARNSRPSGTNTASVPPVVAPSEPSNSGQIEALKPRVGVGDVSARDHVRRLSPSQVASKITILEETFAEGRFDARLKSSGRVSPMLFDDAKQKSPTNSLRATKLADVDLSPPQPSNLDLQVGTLSQQAESSCDKPAQSSHDHARDAISTNKASVRRLGPHVYETKLEVSTRAHSAPDTADQPLPPAEIASSRHSERQAVDVKNAKEELSSADIDLIILYLVILKREHKLSASIVRYFAKQCGISENDLNTKVSQALLAANGSDGFLQITPKISTDKLRSSFDIKLSKRSPKDVIKLSSIT